MSVAALSLLLLLGGSACAQLVQVAQAPFALNTQETSLGSSVLSRELDSYIQDLLNNASIPGYALGIVRLDRGIDAEVEFGNWGNKTEDGDKVTPDVSSLSLILTRTSD
jgi:hypothetical protein